MQFCTSSQAKSWIFSFESLAECRRRALLTELDNDGPKRTSVVNHVRKFASGFHRRNDIKIHPDAMVPSNIKIDEQEIMIQFHAHQIQFLIGPNAILYDLRTNEKVLSTAVIYFRRFYLSNSVIEISPRKVAAACAFFAAKVEEERVEIGLIADATTLVQRRVQSAPLCCKELRAVSVTEIEIAERLLMEGLNYEFHCHHTADIIDEILSNDKDSGPSHQFDDSDGRIDVSPRSSVTAYGCRSILYKKKNFRNSELLRQKALDISRRAHVFSDVPFLFAPRDIAFAIVAIASGLTSSNFDCIGCDQLHHYKIMHPEKSQDELASDTSCIRDAIEILLNCQNMDLSPMHDPSYNYLVMGRAEELRCVMAEVASLRLLRKMNRRKIYREWHNRYVGVTVLSINAETDNRGKKRLRCSSHAEKKSSNYHSTKRTRMQFDIDFTPPRLIRTYT